MVALDISETYSTDYSHLDTSVANIRDDTRRRREATDWIIGEVASIEERLHDEENGNAATRLVKEPYEHMASPSVHTTRDLAYTHNVAANDRKDAEF